MKPGARLLWGSAVGLAVGSLVGMAFGAVFLGTCLGGLSGAGLGLLMLGGRPDRRTRRSDGGDPGVPATADSGRGKGRHDDDRSDDDGGGSDGGDGGGD